MDDAAAKKRIGQLDDFIKIAKKLAQRSYTNPFERSIAVSDTAFSMLVLTPPELCASKAISELMVSALKCAAGIDDTNNCPLIDFKS